MTEKTTTTKPAGAEKPANDPATQAKAAVDSAVKAGKDAARKNFGDALSRGREQLDDLSKRYQSAVDDLVKYSRANLEAMMSVAGTVSSAAQDMSRSWYGFARQEAERSAEAAQSRVDVLTYPFLRKGPASAGPFLHAHPADSIASLPQDQGGP